MTSKISIKVADEVWVATSILHREQPEREGFTVAEIVDMASREKLTERIRPGVAIHAYQHCVANRRPNPGNHKMLFALPNRERRLFRAGDVHHPYREGGKITPEPDDLPVRYRSLVEWYLVEYASAGSDRSPASVNRTLDGSLSIWDQIERIWAEVPVEERVKLPSDGAACHDRYIRAHK
jgi:hypothetical protein